MDERFCIRVQGPAIGAPAYLLIEHKDTKKEVMIELSKSEYKLLMAWGVSIAEASK